MIESAVEVVVENTGNRDNTVNTTCRVSGFSFRPGLIYVDQEGQNEISLINDYGQIGDSWFLDDSLDSLPNNKEYLRTQQQYNLPLVPLPNVLADQEAVGAKVNNQLISCVCNSLFIYFLYY
jgi:hypothetical protein